MTKIHSLKILLLLEKSFIIKKELSNLHNIAYFFYSGEERKKSSNQTFENLYNEINITLDDVNKVIENINKFKNKDFVEPLFFFIECDSFNTIIDKILKTISLLSDKLFQMKKENFPGYNPSPLIGKRYSSKGFVDYLGRNYNELIESFSDNKWIQNMQLDDNQKMKKSTVFHWDYSDMYYVPRFYESESKENEKLKHIKLAYWNHDIPVLIPAITHEVAHLLINHNLIFNELIELNLYKIKNTYLNKSLGKFGIRKLFEEFYADLFSFTIHKESYIFTLFYVIFGKDFCNTFVKNDIKILPELQFSSKRDYSIIRISALIEIYLNSELVEKKDETFLIHIKEMKKVINSIYPIWEIEDIGENNLSSIFEEYWTHQRNFENLTDIICDMKNFLVYGNIDEVQDDYLNELFKYTESINNHIKESLPKSNVFSNFDKMQQLWNDRISNPLRIKHKKFFREMLMQHDEIEFLEPYELNYHKLHMIMGNNKDDSRNNNKQGYFDSIIKNINDQNLNNPFYKLDSLDFACNVFGSYHMVSLKKKSDDVKIEEAINCKSGNNTSEYHYFTKKHSLLEIKMPSFNSINSDTCLEGLGFIVQIQLFDNTNSELSNLIDEIKEKFNQYSTKYRAFKSLGPSEVVMIFYNINLEDIFDIKKIFSSSIDSARRTTSSIFFKSFDSNIKSTKKYFLTSEIRLSSTYKNNENKKELIISYLKKIKNKIKDFIEKPGELDLQIIWNEGTSLEDLNNLYHHIKKDEIATDVQSNFNLRISL